MFAGLYALGQTAACIGNQTAVGDDVEQVFRYGTDREGLAVGADGVVVHIDGNDVAAGDDVLNAVAGQQQDAAVERIAEEDAGKALGDDAAHAVVAQDRGRLLT